MANLNPAYLKVVDFPGFTNSAIYHAEYRIWYSRKWLLPSEVVQKKLFDGNFCTKFKVCGPMCVYLTINSIHFPKRTIINGKDVVEIIRVHEYIAS